MARFFKILLLALFCVPLIRSTSVDASEPLRAMFVWSLEDRPVLSSVERMNSLIAFSKQHHITTLFVQVYRANKSWFASRHADDSPYHECFKSVGQDPLGLFIAKAHAAGIEVHAWMNLLSLSANVDAPMLKKYGPSILTRDREAKSSLNDYKIDRQFFLEPSNRQVRSELVSIVTELIKAYPALDGVQFDYIRYPDVHPFYGYSPDNMQNYMSARRKSSVIESDPDWKQWKRDQVTLLLELLVARVKTMRPGLHISTTGCLSYGRARDEALQEWPLWIKRGLVEFVTLMNYPPDLATYEKNVKGIVPWVDDLSRVNLAVGAYKFEQGHEEVFLKQFDYCRQAFVRACVVFHYGSLLQNVRLRDIYQDHS